jgi:hypothetical protein
MNMATCGAWEMTMFPNTALDVTTIENGTPAKIADIKPTPSDESRLNPSNSRVDYDTRVFSAGAGSR